MCSYVVSRANDSVMGARSHIARSVILFFVVGGKRGVWGEVFENVFTSLDREGGVSFQITGTSVVVSAETYDITSCVVAGTGI